jgi:hypothetical protein
MTVNKITGLKGDHEARPLWFQMLLAWKEEDRTRTGLTLPFLIGAALRNSIELRVLDEAEAFRELADLLTAIWHEVPSTHVVRIGYCKKVKAPVAGVYLADDPDGRYKATLVPYPRNQKSRRGRGELLAEDQYFAGEPKDFNALAAGLDREVGEAICSGRLSRESGRNVDYTKDDKLFIARVKATAIRPKKVKVGVAQSGPRRPGSGRKASAAR